MHLRDFQFQPPGGQLRQDVRQEGITAPLALKTPGQVCKVGAIELPGVGHDADRCHGKRNRSGMVANELDATGQHRLDFFQGRRLAFRLAEYRQRLIPPVA